MAFDALEQSKQSGAPQFLYEFALNEHRWRYVSGTGTVTVGGQTYAPLPISDNGVRQKGDPTSETLTVTMPNTVDIVRFFASTPPSSPVYLTVRSYHVGDAEAVVRYVGEVMNVNQPQPGKAELACSTLSASMARNGLRLTWSRTCPHSVYDTGCKVNKTAFKTDAVIATVGPGVITSPTFATFPDGWFKGGLLEWVDPDRGLERRAIEDHVGNQLLMFGTSDGLFGGQEVSALPGCDRTTLTCRDKFNNLPNYGGCPSMPDKSPFDGDPVY